jgi:hypothetical protein
MRNEQGKNDETRTGEDAGLPARGRVAQEQASESVRNNAQVSMRTRARALYIAAHDAEPDSVRESNGLTSAIGNFDRMATPRQWTLEELDELADLLTASFRADVAAYLRRNFMIPSGDGGSAIPANGADSTRTVEIKQQSSNDDAYTITYSTPPTPEEP